MIQVENEILCQYFCLDMTVSPYECPSGKITSKTYRAVTYIRKVELCFRYAECRIKSNAKFIRSERKEDDGKEVQQWGVAGYGVVRGGGRGES